MKLHRLLPYFLGVYLGVGLCLGALVWKAIPAMNMRGWVYIAATWPAWLEVSPVHLPAPSWAFSFPTSTTEKGADRP